MEGQQAEMQSATWVQRSEATPRGAGLGRILRPELKN
jgi:hypothetical protein